MQKKQQIDNIGLDVSKLFYEPEERGSLFDVAEIAN